MANLFRNLGDTKRNLRELTLLRKLNHKNIAKLLDVVIEVIFFINFHFNFLYREIYKVLQLCT